MRIIFLLFFLATTVNAQWVVVRDDTVKPPMLAAYAHERTIALTNLHYLTMTNVASLDAARAAATAWPAPDAVESRSVAIWRLRPDLSYEPAAPRLSSDEETFVHFDVFACLPGHEAELEALTKEYVAVDRDAGVRHRWRIYEVVIGNDLPAWVLATPARSRSDYDSEKIAADALRKGRDLPLHVRNTRLLRHLTSFEGTVRR